jgi:HAD superfamily hydrolase (TIGR01549 family)
MNLESFLLKYHKKYLIFDFDRTLITLDLPWEILRSQLRQTISQLDNKIVPQYQRSIPLRNAAIKKYGQQAKKIIYPLWESFETSYLKGTTPNSGLINFIKNNSQQYALYIWSSNFSKTILPLLKKYKIINLFKRIITHESVDLLKPSPDGFYRIFKPTFQHKKDFLLIGDNDNDRLAAQNAGIDFFNIKEDEESLPS